MKAETIDATYLITSQYSVQLFAMPLCIGDSVGAAETVGNGDVRVVGVPRIPTQ